MPVFQFIALLATTLFTGAAIYISVAEHPARMESGTILAATVFGPSYRRAAAMQVVLALTGTAAGTGAWVTGASREWLIGAILLFTVVPFTLVAIRPTNQKLLDPAIDRGSDVVRRDLERWGKLHSVRSILSLASSIVLLGSMAWT